MQFLPTHWRTTMSQNIPLSNSIFDLKHSKTSSLQKTSKLVTTFDNLTRVLNQASGLANSVNITEVRTNPKQLFNRSANKPQRESIKRFIPIPIEVSEDEVFEFKSIHDNVKARPEMSKIIYVLLEYINSRQIVSWLGGADHKNCLKNKSTRLWSHRSKMLLRT